MQIASSNAAHYCQSSETSSMQKYLAQSCAGPVTGSASNPQNGCSVSAPMAYTSTPDILIAAGAGPTTSWSGLPQLYRLAPAMQLSTSCQSSGTSRPARPACAPTGPGALATCTSSCACCGACMRAAMSQTTGPMQPRRAGEAPLCGVCSVLRPIGCPSCLYLRQPVWWPRPAGRNTMHAPCMPCVAEGVRQ